eukprot:59283-Amphidinium_carterae.1
MVLKTRLRVGGSKAVQSKQMLRFPGCASGCFHQKTPALAEAALCFQNWGAFSLQEELVGLRHCKQRLRGISIQTKRLHEEFYT